MPNRNAQTPRACPISAVEPHTVRPASSTNGPRARGTLPARPLSRRALVAGAAVGIGTLLSGCSGPELASILTGGSDTGAQAKPASGSTFAFDTYCTFTVYGDDSALAKLSRACARYDALLDLYKEDSDIARINAAGGAATTVDPDTADVIERALAYCERADGLFDITIGAVSTLWDFDAGTRPTEEQLAAALPHVDWRCVSVAHGDDGTATVALADPQAKLDLGAIAKGYVADRLVELLRDETKATAGVISLGGNIAYFGTKPDGEPWETGIRDPNDPGGSTVVDTVRVTGGSLVTSGLYERTFELDGVTYWHILDPRTGMPVETDVESDTVACASSTQADALSTTLFVAGSERGAQIADSYEDTAAYFITRDGGTPTSSRWDDLTSA